MIEPPKECDEIVDALQSGESIRWTGRPAQGVRMTGSDWMILPGSAFFLAFAVFWNSEVWQIGSEVDGAPLFFKLFGLPFLAWGLFMVFGRPFWDAYRRAHTFYAITDSRVLIVVSAFGRKLQSVVPGTLTEISLEEQPDGRGTLWLGPQPSVWARYGAEFGNRRGQPLAPCLESVENARAVQDLLLSKTAGDMRQRIRPA